VLTDTSVDNKQKWSYKTLNAGAEDAPYPVMQVGVPYPAFDSPPEKED